MHHHVYHVHAGEQRQTQHGSYSKCHFGRRSGGRCRGRLGHSTCWRNDHRFSCRPCVNHRLSISYTNTEPNISTRYMYVFQLMINVCMKKNSFSNIFSLFESGGVNNLHGMPGLMSGVASAIVAAIATPHQYGDNNRLDCRFLNY